MKPATLKLFTNIKDFHEAYEKHYVAANKPQGCTFRGMYGIRLNDAFKPVVDSDNSIELSRQLRAYEQTIKP